MRLGEVPPARFWRRHQGTRRKRTTNGAEWRGAVAADPELAIGQPETSGPRGASIGIWAVWQTYPGGYPAWFVLLKNGDIEVKGMDKPLFGKFQKLASALGARIFCETGEELS
jgi:hypothetical protein